MSKKLAIRGHSTRGKEVIKLLEMIGGSNIYQHDGEANAYSYYISGNVILHDRLSIAEDDDFEIFTLEEFLEKFPFKVGDFVRIPEYESEVRILKMKWCPVSKHIEYLVCPNDEDEWFTADELLEDNDNPNEQFNWETQPKKNDMRKTGYTLNELIDLVPLTSDSVMIAVRKGFEIIEEHGKFFLKEKKSTYPKTYDECSAVLNLQDSMIQGRCGYEWRLISYFQQLLMCRDAYWKIAGEEMGLDRPWKPDWNDVRKFYCIYNSGNKIVKSFLYTENKILLFPTEEMRDAFYENFKIEIEECKELL